MDQHWPSKILGRGLWHNSCGILFEVKMKDYHFGCHFGRYRKCRGEWVYKVDGIEVIILYPSGKVSDLQEKQLTTLGENIRALEIDGSFDDCQSLVKQAFLDKELTLKFKLSSANSINIARLIPQSFYYANAYKQLKDVAENLVFAVPSGNFGDLTAGLFARQMGMPVKDFIAVSNANDVVPAYLKSGIFTAKPSIQTLSNAMDVGNPSNFARMMDILIILLQGYKRLSKAIPLQMRIQFWL